MAIGTSIIRYPNKKRNKANKIKSNKKGTLEKILVGLVFLGMVILPFIYIFTNLFYFANYNLPVLLQIVGSLLIVPMQGTIFQT